MADDSKNIDAIKKILVAVDHTSNSSTAMEYAVLFAKITKAHIHGIYVREDYWERIHPKTTFINEFTGKTHSVKNHPQQQIEAIEKRLEKKLKQLSLLHEINHSWKSLKGQIADEILKAGDEADLIIIGRRSRSLLSNKKLGSTAKAIIKQSAKPVLVLAETGLEGKTICTVFDGTDNGYRALNFALAIAKKRQHKLLIITFFKKGDENNFNNELKQITDKTTIPTKVAALTNGSIGNFILFAKQQNPDLLLLSKKHRMLQNNSTEMLLHYLNCAVLFM